MVLGISDFSPSVEREFGNFVPLRREASVGRISGACKEICQGMAWYVLPKWQVKGGMLEGHSSERCEAHFGKGLFGGPCVAGERTSQ